MKLKFFSFNKKCAKVSNNKLIDIHLSLTYIIIIKEELKALDLCLYTSLLTIEISVN